MIFTVLNLRSIDLNLLPVFEAAYEERSLSRAAARLAMTQPAVSHAMARLRTVFRDQLFVRQSKGMLPTPVANEIYAKLRGTLDVVREAVSDRRSFDALTSERQFFITIPHPLGPMIALRLHERLAKAAPNVIVTTSTRSRPIDLDRSVRDGRVDAVIDWIEVGGNDINRSLLFEDSLVAVARNHHPAFRIAVTRKTLQAGSFVTLRARVEGEHPLEGIREWHRLKLNYVLEVSEILEILMVASQSDLFGLIPRSMEKVARDVFNLRTLGWAPKSPHLPIKLYWHASRDADPGQAFLRTHLTQAAKEVVKPG